MPRRSNSANSERPLGRRRSKRSKSTDIFRKPKNWTDLSPEQKDAYAAEFKERLVLAGLIKHGQKTLWNHPIQKALERFLRAREYDLEAALDMLKIDYFCALQSCLKWRKSFGTDSIITDFDFTEREEVIKLYPRMYFLPDRTGRPVYVERVGKLQLDPLLKTTTLDRLLKGFVQEYEIVVKYWMPKLSEEHGYHIDTTFSVFDLEGAKFSLFGRHARDFLRDVSKITQDYYPELLGHLFIVNTPSFFRTLWPIAKGFLNPRTVSKITILGRNYREKLHEAVDPDHLPSWLGGNYAHDNGFTIKDVVPLEDVKTKESTTNLKGLDSGIPSLKIDMDEREESKDSEYNIADNTPKFFNAKEMNGDDGGRFQTGSFHSGTNGTTSPPISLVSRVQQLQNQLASLSAGGASSNPDSSTATANKFQVQSLRERVETLETAVKEIELQQVSKFDKEREELEEVIKKQKNEMDSLKRQIDQTKNANSCCCTVM